MKGGELVNLKYWIGTILVVGRSKYSNKTWG